MLTLIQTEFLKLRRKKFAWLTLPAALIMPFFALLYFKYLGQSDVEPMLFYKWSAFGFSLWIILPVILGMLCIMLMQEERQSHTLNQIWIVPVGRMEYFFSKFFVIFVYALCFMLLTFAASVLFSVLPGIVRFEWGSVLRLLEKCLEMGALAALVMLPVLAVAASQKGPIFPACLTLVYVFSGFFLMPVNMYLHPISSMGAILVRNQEIPGFMLTQAISIPFAVLCIGVWDLAAVLLAKLTLKR